jgi:murein DD-endopeptidase MepM/ murein hydrolase activator NlpD
VTLAIIVLSGAVMLLPRVSSAGVDLPDAQPTGLPTDILNSPKPKPSQSSNEPPEGNEGGNGGNNGNNNGNGNRGDGGGDGKGDGKRGDGKGDGKKGDKKKNRKGDGRGKNGRKRKNRKRNDVLPPAGTPSIPGSYTTDKLVSIATLLRSLGMSQADVQKKVYAPFIIAGPAAWIDTWGAPRYGPAPGQVRTHEGQDVFCNYGDPVLASEPGTVNFDNGGLGGITTRLFRADGSYWYYTHLSDWNQELSVGDRVEVGDVIGYCGNTGNAITTPPHVHFGWYRPGGVNARNPMRHLVDWLHEAEQHALTLITEKQAKNIKLEPQRTTQRRFGDGFLPDRSELRVAGESLWASGQAPAMGTFALAQTALQAALSADGYGEGPVPTSTPSAAVGTSGMLDPDSALARLLNSSSTTATHEHGE